MDTKEYCFAPEIRDLIVEALPEDTSLHGRAAEIRHTYLPEAHIKALRPDNMIVVGMRGSGKSFWWAALQQPEHRAAFGKHVGIDKDTAVSTGFGEKSSPDDYPGKGTIQSLLNEFDARKLWLTVALHHICKSILPDGCRDLTTWGDRLDWLESHPEEAERCLLEADNALDGEKRHHLILFDALDRTADDWKTMNDLVRGLLQAALEFRSFKRLRLKIFVRPDQIEDPKVGAFPDASKVLSQKMELFWPRHELYGLLWQYLANEPNRGRLFRDGCRNILNVDWKQADEVWLVPERLHDEEEQRRIFHAIAGPWMGRDRRRGFPYTWLVNHLGDARQEVSPCSFLSAMRRAATDTPRQDQEYALHYESIKRGVQEASKIRLQEVQEDYPWVGNLMAPLAGKVTVPCQPIDVEEIWRNRNVLEELQNSIQEVDVRLPPAHIKGGPSGVLEDLAKLGLIERMSDGRINLPDVYRVGYGIGRRGGVKPVAKRRETR